MGCLRTRGDRPLRAKQQGYAGKEPDFGTDGAVRWIVQLANVSRRSIYQAEVDFTTLDEDSCALTSDFDMVQRVASGDTATINARADLYSTEKRARVRVSNVYFEER